MIAFSLQRLTSGGAPVPSAVPPVGNAQSDSATVRPGETTVAGGTETAASEIGLPDGKLTPGAVDPAANQGNVATTVCKPGWAKSIRPPSAYTSALKLVQIVEYGYADRNPSHYQEDHLVPLELGGAPRDRRNLWPEPNVAVLPDGTAVGSTQKDALEDALHARVCDGSLTLDEGQRMMAGNWVTAWEAAGRP